MMDFVGVNNKIDNIVCTQS